MGRLCCIWRLHYWKYVSSVLERLSELAEIRFLRVIFSCSIVFLYFGLQELSTICSK